MRPRSSKAPDTENKQPNSSLATVAAPTSGPATELSVNRRLRVAGIAALLVVICAVVFVSVIHNDFVIWDDGLNVYSNPYMNPPNAAHIVHFWTQKTMGDPTGTTVYRPLVYTAYAGLAVMAKLSKPHPITGAENAWVDPAYFHAASLAVHILNVLMIFVLLRTILTMLGRRYHWEVEQNRRDWAAFAGALLFAIHPVQVEPVAWITSLTDLMGGFFSMLALWQYLLFAAAGSGHGATSKRRWLHYGFAILCYLLALLSKPSAVAASVVALVLDYYILRRPLRQSLANLSVWFALALAAVIVTRWAEPFGFKDVTWPVWTRIVIAGDALAFYVGHIVLPVDLGIDYGRTPTYVLSHPWGCATWLIPTVLAGVAFVLRKRLPWLVLAGGVFVAALVPVLGLIPFRFQFFSTVADRYLYLAMLGPAIALACAICRTPQRNVVMLAGVLAAVFLGYALKSNVQLVYWETNFSLFRHAIDVNPRSAMAHMNLALCNYKEEMPPVVNAELEEALRLKPDLVEGHYNLGYVLLYERHYPEAVAELRESLRLRPGLTSAQSALGLALLNLHQWAEAADHLRTWLEYKPDDAKARFYLSTALYKQGDRNGAMEELVKATTLDPNFAPAARTLEELRKAGR